MRSVRRLMGIAVGSGKVGFAYLVDGELMDWRLSIEASRTATNAFALASEWLGYYRVDLLVLERPDESRKGPHSQTLHDAVARAAKEARVSLALGYRRSGAPNKYAEAAELAAEFPQLAAWLPDKRRLWEHEPRNIILFEALSLAWNWWQASGPRESEETIDW